MTEKYPHVPGAYKHAPETSRAAADSMAQYAGPIRSRVLAVVRDAGPLGAIGDDVANSLDLHVTQVRSRLSELLADNKIADSGRRRRGASGRRGVAWVLPEYAPEENGDAES